MRGDECDPGADEYKISREGYLMHRITRYRTALADAIRRPMGVVPDSARGLISAADLEAAELRRRDGDA